MKAKTLLLVLSSFLFSENLKIKYDVYVKFPYWIKIGEASFEENKNILEGRVDLKGILKGISYLIPIKEKYTYKTIYGEKTIYYENGKAYEMDGKALDILSIIKNIKDSLVHGKEKNIDLKYRLFIGNRKRNLNIKLFKEGKEEIEVYGLPLIKEVKGKDIKNNIPVLLETSVYGIKFKGVLKNGY